MPLYASVDPLKQEMFLVGINNFTISSVQVASATFFGAIINTFPTSNLLNFKSAIADKVIIVFPNLSPYPALNLTYHQISFCQYSIFSIHGVQTSSCITSSINLSTSLNDAITLASQFKFLSLFIKFFCKGDKSSLFPSAFSSTK